MTPASCLRPRAVYLPSLPWALGLLAVCLLAAAPRGAVGQTTIFNEPFDNDNKFTVTEGMLALNNDAEYFILAQNANPDIEKEYDGAGTNFLAGQNMDAVGSDPAEIEWTGIDISGETGLEFTGGFGEVLDGSGDIDESDFLRVQYQIDGGGYQTLIEFRGDSNGEFAVDTDLDGTGDGQSISSSNGSLVSFTRNISGTGSTLDLRFKASVNADDEDFAVDDFEVTSSPAVQFTASSGSVSEADGSTVLTVEILNPDGNSVDVDVAFDTGNSDATQSDFTSNFPNSTTTTTVSFPSSASDGDTRTVSLDFDDDESEGKETALFDLQDLSTPGNATIGAPSEFDLTIKDAVSDHSDEVLISEVMPDPDAVSDGDGEYIELYNTTTSEIDLGTSGWTLDVDGDTDEIPATIPPRGFLVLCENPTASENGGIKNCDVDYVNGISLNNSGSVIKLLDGGGNQVDLIDYGGTDYPNVPTGASLVFTGTTANNDGNNWTETSRRERGYAQDQTGDDGSPGRNGTGQTLQPTTEITGGAGWRMLSAPMSGVTPEDLADVSLVQGISGLPFSGAASNLYRWPGGPDNQSTNWTKPSSATTDLTGSGRGYIFYVFGTAETDRTDTPPFTLSVPGTPRTSTVSTSSLGDGFHLLGNPYAQSIDPASVDFGGQGFQTTVQIYDPSAGGYKDITTPYTADDFIGPYQGFFVERTSSGNTDLVFNADDRVADPISLKSTEGAPPRIEFQLVGRDGEGSALTRDEALTLHAPEGATADWDVHDASKLTPLSGRYATAAFRDTTDGEARLQSVMSVPSTLPDEGVEVPVSLQLQGTDPVETFRLSWPTWKNVPDDWKVTLHDTAIDSTINLRRQSSYAFTLSTSKAQSVPPPRSPLELPAQIRAKAQSGNSRFTLRLNQGTIPVELTRLHATVSDETARLAWTTASETNNAGFHVEHRGPGAKDFASTGFVEGAGTTDQPQQYRFRTDPLDPGRHVFRLRQVDLDGTATRSDTVAVRVRLATVAEVEVAPNPVRTRATVSLRVRAEQEVEVALYDVLGRRVRTVHEGPLTPGRTHTFRVDAGGLSSGLYLLRADGEQFRRTRRVTVVR
ncbi:MAG: lamin tail domain-containing protein [Salinibacter sp.]|uniref:lamin tail domain-containing protein n=1 Tax=Salinibacter sp. TaxID=2065818 RepID=UPI0035D525A9